MVLLSRSVVFLANSCPRDVFLLPAIILPASRFFLIDVICLNIFLSLLFVSLSLSLLALVFSLHVWPRFISFLCLARILIFYFLASDFLFVNLCVIKAKQINFLFHLVSVCVREYMCVCGVHVCVYVCLHFPACLFIHDFYFDSVSRNFHFARQNKSIS